MDGTYKADESGNAHYTPKTPEELKKIEDLVKVAIGFRDDRKDRIEVINMQFLSGVVLEKEKTASDWIKEELPLLFQTLVLAVVVVLVFVTVVRPIALKIFDVKRANELEQATADREAKASTDSNHDEIDIKYVEQSIEGPLSTKKVGEIVQAYPQETLMVLRKWLNESD